MYVAPTQEGRQPDLGVAVAKKLAKRAVDRNRLKRMIRELVWTAQANTLIGSSKWSAKNKTDTIMLTFSHTGVNAGMPNLL